VRPTWIVIALLAAGCSTPSPPTVTAERVSVRRVDANGLAIDLTVSATNPNSVDLVASGVSSHVIVDKTHDVGTVVLPNTITLPAGKTTRLDVPITLKWSEMGLLAQLAMTTNAVPYSVDGTLDLGGNLLHAKVPFRFEGTIAHAEIAGAVINSLPKLR
jgi:LEA14-like dessication related protein